MNPEQVQQIRNGIEAVRDAADNGRDPQEIIEKLIGIADVLLDQVADDYKMIQKADLLIGMMTPQEYPPLAAV